MGGFDAVDFGEGLAGWKAAAYTRLRRVDEHVTALISWGAGLFYDREALEAGSYVLTLASAIRRTQKDRVQFHMRVYSPQIDNDKSRNRKRGNAQTSLSWLGVFDVALQHCKVHPMNAKSIDSGRVGDLHLIPSAVS